MNPPNPMQNINIGQQMERAKTLRKIQEKLF